MWHTNEDIHRGAENLLAHKRLAAHTPIVIREEQRNPEYLTHTAENGYCCGQGACACMAELEHLPPYEQAAQPLALTDADYAELEPEHPPACRCAWCEPVSYRDVINHAPWLW